MFATVKVDVPATRLDAIANAPLERWRDLTAGDIAVKAMLARGGPPLPFGLEPLLESAGRVTLTQRGQVLAVPDTAVIDTGSRKFVYREAWPGVYDGVEVRLGPRSGAFYPVVRGLEAGDRVVTAGSFLVDAETRLTAGAGSTYFGASGGPAGDRPTASTQAARPSMAEDEDAKINAVLANLSRVDRKLAEAQGYCPILGGKLGGMGLPFKIILKDQPVFLCCKGCEKEARSDPDQTLTKVESLKAEVKAGSVPQPQTRKTPAEKDREDPKIKKAIAKLSPEDQVLARAQGFCAVREENPLGSMGRPYKIVLNGQTVFLCCSNCEEEARAQPAQTLAAVQRLKAKVKAASSQR
jgi:hypothetical protein